MGATVEGVRGAGEMAKEVEGLVAKPSDLTLILGTRMMERNSCKLSYDLHTSVHTHKMCTCTYMNTCSN